MGGAFDGRNRIVTLLAVANPHRNLIHAHHADVGEQRVYVQRGV